MKVGKPKSKRVPVRLRHKIEKASAAKQRKQRKLAKKDPQWRSRLKKDPGIPNLFPFKEKILQEIEEKRRLKEEEIMRRREEAKARRAEISPVATHTQNGTAAPEEAEAEPLLDYSVDEEDAMDEDDSSNPMAALLASARARVAEYEHAHGASSGDEMDEDDSEWDGFEDGDEGLSTVAAPSRKESTRRAFDKVFKQVVDAADVVLYVLDARDPDGTRSREVERSVMAADGGQKRLILVLNKIDLVPPAVLKGWLVHLRRYFPTIPLAAAHPAANARSFDHKRLTVRGTSETLLKALKSYAQSRQLKRSTSVGVIGYPNVGKSSVINALTSRLGGRTTACPVGAEAGVTTVLREVKLDGKLTLLDSPGIVFPSPAATTSSTTTATASTTKAHKAEERARLILLNAVPARDIDDPVPAVSLLLRRLATSEDRYAGLLAAYGLPPLMPAADGDVTTDFLVQVARRRGRLGKGGVPNLHGAAQAVLTDWRDGRIQGWVDAPALPVATSAPAQGQGADGVDGAEDEAAMEGDRKEIVKEWAAEFKLEGLWGDGEDAEAMEA